jgi:hypothetical protein
LAVQSYARTSPHSFTAPERLAAVRLQVSHRRFLVLFLSIAILTSFVWALDRQDDLQDLGSFLHSGAAYEAGFNPYVYYYGLEPQPISREALNLNPPVSVYLFAELTYVSQELVSIGFILGTVLMLGAAIYLLVREYPEKRDPLVLLTVCALAGVWHTLGYLQLYAPLILAVVVAWLLMKHDKPLLAGLAIGLVVAIKPNFVLWPVFLLAAGHPKASLSAFGMAAAISGIPLLIDGPGIYRQWLEVTRSFNGIEWASNASLVSIGARFGLEPAGLVLSVGAVIALLFWSRDSRPGILEASTLSILATLIAGPVSWAGYTLFLLPWLFSRPWTHQIWLALVMLAMPFWLVRFATVAGPLSGAMLGSVYGWAVLLLLVVVVGEHLRTAADGREATAAAAA